MKLSVAQVSRILGIDRKTVRRYRDMSQEQISALVDNEVRRRLCKLEPSLLKICHDFIELKVGFAGDLLD